MLRNYCFLFLFTILSHGQDADADATLCLFDTSKCIGELKPDNPFVYIGDELVLNCSLNTPQDGSYNALDLRFTHHDDIDVAEEDIHILSEYLAQLRLTITSPKNKSHYMCILNNQIVGVQDLSLEYRPRPVENVSCVVANWDTMTCNWQLGPYVKVEDINILPYWWVQSGNGYYTCDRSSQTSCFFNASSYNEGNMYTMMIEVSYKPKNREMYITNGNYTIYADQLVKPDPVADLTANAVNSTCLHLTWSHSRSEKNLKYRLRYYSQWDKETEILLNPGRSLKHTVCGLHPNTLYNFTVAAHPRTQGFWSETVHTSTTTLEDE
ncbi:interleukin-6 receptor subunit beta [Patella vulgata]|uniref:interleukin-6 receptor subunit beta n=1 Tax=Patella vulgata TaxID=6465 RepID=UPI00218084A1|nr:interleukin-6 receptor subunit beta [Patella vulgata]